MSFLSFLSPIANLGSTYLEGKNQVAKAKSAAAFAPATFTSAAACKPTIAAADLAFATWFLPSR